MSFVGDIRMCPHMKKATVFGAFASFCTPAGIAAILYECRLGCLAEKIPQETEDYIDALHLMFSSFKTTMYAGAIPKWLRPVFPKPWEEFCDSWDGLFRFSEWLTTKRQRHFFGLKNLFKCKKLTFLSVTNHRSLMWF